MATTKRITRLLFALTFALFSYVPGGACQGAPDFMEAVLPSVVTINRADSAVFTINVMPVGNFSGDVTLRVDGLPPNTSATFNPAVINAPNPTSTLTIAPSSDPIDGENGNKSEDYVLTVTATSASVVHSGQVTLSVAKSKDTRVVRRVSFLGQSPAVSIPPTTLFVPEEDGLYRVTGYMVPTAAEDDPATARWLTVYSRFAWTDVIRTRFVNGSPGVVFGLFDFTAPLSGVPFDRRHYSTTNLVLYAKASTPILFETVSPYSLQTLARFAVYLNVEKL